MIELGVAGVLLLLLVLLVYWYVDGLSAYKPGEATHQYVLGNMIGYDENAVFRDAKENMTVASGDGKHILTNSPILYEGTTKLTLPVNMLLMVPAEGTGLCRINYFTTVTETQGV